MTQSNQYTKTQTKSPRQLAFIKIRRDIGSIQFITFEEVSASLGFAPHTQDKSKYVLLSPKIFLKCTCSLKKAMSRRKHQK